MAAASDVAAMGAEPWCALAALVLPEDLDDASLGALARGQREAAVEARAPIVGGNLSRGPVLSVATTFLGRCTRAIERRGARPGDGVWLAGRVGLAAAGLRALSSGRKGPGIEAAVDAWARPRARFEEGRAMAASATAAVDISDGLAGDIGHLAESSAVRVVLDAHTLLDDEDLVAAASVLGVAALELALYGGEDYAIVATAREVLPGFRRIGEVRDGAGVAVRTDEGERPVAPLGFDHFTGPSKPPAASGS